MLSAQDIKGWVAKALRAIYKGLKGNIEQNLFELESQNLIDAVETGMGGFEYGKPNFDLSLKLAQSGLWFAARKSYAEANDLAALLPNNGTKRSWSEFRKLAAPIVGKYNQTWLKTEYDTALRSARMASVWVDIERTADLYPNVEYVRTRSATPREKHLQYVGIIRPIRDAFWLTHTPPLAWLCKCSIRPSKAQPTAIPEGLPEPDPGLANNAALSETLFTENHPYAVNAKAVEETLRREFNQARSQMGAYFKVKTPKQNLVLVHPGHQSSELGENLPIAIQLTDSLKGYNVKLRTYQEGQGKQPDFEINNKPGDLKTLKTATNLAGAIQAQISSVGSQQAHYAVLDLSAFSPTKRDIEKALRAATQEGFNKSVQEIILIHKKSVVAIKREEIRDRSFIQKLTQYP